MNDASPSNESEDKEVCIKCVSHVICVGVLSGGVHRSCSSHVTVKQVHVTCES